VSESEYKLPDTLRAALVGLVLDFNLRSVMAYDGRHVIELREPSVMELAPVEPPLYGLVLEVRDVDL